MCCCYAGEQKHHHHHASPGDRAKQLFTSDTAARKGKKKSFNKSSPSLKSSTESYGQLRRADSETYGGSKHFQASPAQKHGTMPAPRRQSAGHPGERAPSPPRRRSDIPARVTSPPPRNPAPFPSAVIDATIAEYMSTSAAESMIAAKPPLPPDLPPADDADASEVRRRSDAPTPKGAAPVPPAVVRFNIYYSSMFIVFNFQFQLLLGCETSRTSAVGASRCARGTDCAH